MGITAGIVVAVGVILAVVVVAAIQSTSPALPTNEPVVTETPIATHRDFEQELADERHRNDMLQARHADELAEKDARIRELDTRLVSTPPIRTVTVTPGRKAVQGRQALRVGLTRAEVLKLQGNPYHKMASRGKEVWYFGRLMDDYIIFDSGSGVVTGWKNKTGALRD